MHQRIDDAPTNRYFGLLMEEGERLIVDFDPPSKTVNAAKLERNLRSCDGMGGHQGRAGHLSQQPSRRQERRYL